MIDAISVPGTLAEAIGRLLVAAALGVLIGIDREIHQKPAGIRTHALVAVGAALLAIVGVQATPFEPRDALSRVIQGVMAGIGFVGGGVILRGRGGAQPVHGLTTAASIWVVAAVGIAVGTGLWRTAVAAVVVVMVLLVLGKPVDRWIDARVRTRDRPGG